MNISAWTTAFYSNLSALAAKGALDYPIWVGLIVLTLFILRRPVLKLTFKVLGISDPALQDVVRQKIDHPIQFELLMIGLMPLARFMEPDVGHLYFSILQFLAVATGLFVLIQAFDLGFFGWYLGHRGVSVSYVVRFFALGVAYGLAFLLLLDWGLGVSVLPLLATSTVLTAVLGLGLQDTLKNVFAGLNMSLEHSFAQGDWVTFRMDGNEMWVGQIMEIGWRTTRIRTLDDAMAVIPNSKFTMHELINLSRSGGRNARTIKIPVNLKAEPVAVIKTLEAGAAKVDGVLADPRPEASIMELQKDQAMYQLRFWMEDVEGREMRTGKVFAAVLSELADMGALPGN